MNLIEGHARLSATNKNSTIYHHLLSLKPTNIHHITSSSSILSVPSRPTHHPKLLFNAPMLLSPLLILLLVAIGTFALLATTDCGSCPSLIRHISFQVESKTTSYHRHIKPRQTPILTQNTTNSTSDPSPASGQPVQPSIRKPLVVVTLVIAGSALLAIWYVMIRNLCGSYSRWKEGRV